MPGTVIRLGIADDHPMTREGLVQLFDSVEDVVVVGEASDGEEALGLVGVGEEADVILLDVRMPKIDGLQVARKINKEDPSVGVIMLSAYDDRRYVVEALKAGARGYVLKTAGGDELIETVRLVASGHLVVDPQLVEVLAEEISGVKGQEGGPTLTERELQVLELLATGHTNREIAERLSISKETVKSHVDHIFEKLGTSDRAAAVAKALRRNLID